MNGAAGDEAGGALALTGLAIASPIGFMAAIGLLRVCSVDHGRTVRLSWDRGHAWLHGIGRDELTAVLHDHMKGRSQAPEFNFEVTDEKGQRGPVMHVRKISPGDYRAAARAFGDDARACAFLAGFGTDAVVSDKGFVARTRLDFTSGQQKLVEEMRGLAKRLDPTEKRPTVPWSVRVERALFGGPYEQQHTLGWDPASLMTHAMQAAAPTKSPTPGQPMTVWLAIEALPLHPVVPVSARRAITTGFVGGSTYVWPQWRVPLGLDEVETLRQRPVVSLSELPGVDAVWASSVTSVGKYGFLLPGARTSSDRVGAGRFAQTETDEVAEA